MCHWCRIACGEFVYSGSIVVVGREKLVNGVLDAIGDGNEMEMQLDYIGHTSRYVLRKVKVDVSKLIKSPRLGVCVCVSVCVGRTR